MSDPTAETLLRLRRCELDFEIYDDYEHIKSNGPEILGFLKEFCVAFYHVPVNNDQGCLDKDNCKAAADGPWWTPRSVVALVIYEIYNGRDIIVRYSNHYIRGATKHAEKFFKDDINQPKNAALRSSISDRNLRKITMYITFQPCHLSVEKTPTKSCCDVLLELLNDPRLKDVEMCIKPTHIYKAWIDGSTLVENGKDGIRKLMVRGIKITRMEEADWNFLLNLVEMTDRKRRKILSSYSGSKRKALDVEIGNFLRFQLALECPSTHNRLSVKHYLEKQDGVLHLLDNLFQFCAFYHVFEQGAENENPCLRECPYHINGKWKPNVIVVNGRYQNSDDTYEAKFTDCHRFGIKGEEFLCHSDLPCKVTKDRDNNIKVITIYTTWLSPDFCSKVSFLCTRLMLLNVSLSIKPSHIYKTRSEQLQGNGKKEIRKLMDAVGERWSYINITRMEKADWDDLLSLTTMSEDQRTRIPAYSGSGRERLDKEIGEFLRNIKIEIANSLCPYNMHTHCLIRANEGGASHLFDDLSQFCEFFHVFEQDEENENLCLSESQVKCEKGRPNVIVVKGESEQHATMYQAKYIDCHRFHIKAEEFLHFSAKTACNNLDQITIYTTWLPRGFHRIVDHLSSLVAAVFIKLSHLHDGDDTSRDDFQNEVDALRRNEQITVQAMTEDDWQHLTENLPGVPEYEDSRRQHLDKEIEQFLNPTASSSSGSGGFGGGGTEGDDDDDNEDDE